MQLRSVIPEGCANVFVKLEFFNPTGSYKDRMAKAMIEEAEQRGDLKPGTTVVEATGGSTGSSLSFICAVKGYPFVAFTSDAFAMEKLRTIEAFGATLDVTSSPSGKTSSDLMSSIMSRAEEKGREDSYYYVNQFVNRDALVGYSQIGHELMAQFPNGFDAFCGSVGTAGMAMGVARVIKSEIPRVKVVILEPSSSPLMTKGQAGSHGVDGIAPGFIAPHLDTNLYDEIRAIDEQEARSMCRLLAKKEGLLIGTSSGLNIVAAIQLAKELGPGKSVVTVAIDTGLKYLSGPLFAEP